VFPGAVPRGRLEVERKGRIMRSDHTSNHQGQAMKRQTRVGIGVTATAAAVILVGGMLMPADAQPRPRPVFVTGAADGSTWVVHLPGTEGDVADGTYRDWHSVQKVTWSASVPAAAAAGSGRAAGRPQVQPVRILKTDNLGSPATFATLTRGHAIPKVQLVQLDRNGHPRYRLVLTNARVTSFAHEGTAGRGIEETIEIGYEKIEVAVVRREGERETSATYDTERNVTSTR